MISESVPERGPKPASLDEQWTDRIWDINRQLTGYREPTQEELDDGARAANALAEEIIGERHTVSPMLETQLSICYEHIVKLGLADKTPALKALLTSHEI